jgi:hypothetical protein
MRGRQALLLCNLHLPMQKVSWWGKGEIAPGRLSSTYVIDLTLFEGTGHTQVNLCPATGLPTPLSEPQQG